MNNIDKIRQLSKVEIRSMVRRSGKPKLVPYVDRYNYTGFTSMYGLPTQAVSQIESSGRTAGLNNTPVFSDTLYVDFDNNEDAAEELNIKLKGLNVDFDRYHSGGRSIHFHIRIIPMYGVNVPYSQKHWMELNAPKADMSIYKHAGVYRLPGTYHSNYPGQTKHLLESCAGEALLIENRPRVYTKLYNNDTLTIEDFHSILGSLLHKKAGEGGRHPLAFKIASCAKASGKTESHTSQLLWLWNVTNCFPPKAEWELDKIVRYFYD